MPKLRKGRSAQLPRGTQSIEITVRKGASNPEAALIKGPTRRQARQKDAGLRPGHVKVIKTKSYLLELLNYGWCDIEYKVPAPRISPPVMYTDSDADF